MWNVELITVTVDICSRIQYSFTTCSAHSWSVRKV